MADESRVYGKKTAVKSVLAGMANKELLHLAQYPTEKSRANLMAKALRVGHVQPPEGSQERGEAAEAGPGWPRIAARK